MKPFDLKAAKRGEPLVTRAGKKVEEFHHFESCRDTEYACIAVIDGERESFNIEGRFHRGVESEADLLMAPKKRTVYVQVFGIAADAGGVPALRAVAFENKADAERNVVMTTFPVLVAVLPVEIEG
jgi:hypothetical protein